MKFKLSILFFLFHFCCFAQNDSAKIVFRITKEESKPSGYFILKGVSDTIVLKKINTQLRFFTIVYLKTDSAMEIEQSINLWNCTSNLWEYHFWNYSNGFIELQIDYQGGGEKQIYFNLKTGDQLQLQELFKPTQWLKAQDIFQNKCKGLNVCEVSCIIGDSVVRPYEFRIHHVGNYVSGILICCYVHIEPSFYQDAPVETTYDMYLTRKEVFNLLDWNGFLKCMNKTKE